MSPSYLQPEMIIVSRRARWMPFAIMIQLTLLFGAYAYATQLSVPEGSPLASGWFGVASHGEDSERGVLVDEVVGCPAAKAGIIAGDRLLSWRFSAPERWNEIEDMDSLQTIAVSLPNHSVEFLILGANQVKRHVSVKMAAVYGAYPPPEVDDVNGCGS